MELYFTRYSVPLLSFGKGRSLEGVESCQTALRRKRFHYTKMAGSIIYNYNSFFIWRSCRKNSTNKNTTMCKSGKSLLGKVTSVTIIGYVFFFFFKKPAVRCLENEMFCKLLLNHFPLCLSVHFIHKSFPFFFILVPFPLSVKGCFYPQSRRAEIKNASGLISDGRRDERQTDWV